GIAQIFRPPVDGGGHADRILAAGNAFELGRAELGDLDALASRPVNELPGGLAAQAGGVDQDGLDGVAALVGVEHLADALDKDDALLGARLAIVERPNPARPVA